MSIGKIKKAVAKIVAITALVSSVMTTVGFAQVSEINDNKYIINSVTMNNRDVEYSRVPSKGNFYVNIYFEASESEFVPATALVAAYSEDGKLVSVNYEEITEDINLDGRCSVYIGACSTAISAVKIFIWNSIDGMKPLSESFSIVNEPLKEYGVVVGMYTIAGSDYPTVRIITADGKVEAYEAKSVKVAEAKLAVVSGIGDTKTVNGVDCTTIEVIEGGVESVEIFIEGEVSFAEGEII